MAVQILAHAKLNLTLEVLGRRDDGYHEVRSVLQTIDLADRLEVRPHHRLQVQCDDPRLDGEANLVWRAAVGLARSRGLQPKAAITIQKRIPVGMGLGGGSSDAAAALVALNRLWQLSLSREELAQVAAGVGSDVPFFLWGGTALAQGRGERIQPLPPLPSLPVTLVCSDIASSDKTARLYRCLTPAHYSDGATSRMMEEALTQGRFGADMAHNVFEQVAFSAFPGLEQLRRRLTHPLVGRWHLTGSGPGLYCIPSSQEEYGRVHQLLPATGVRAYLVHTVTPEPAALEGTDDHPDARPGTGIPQAGRRVERRG